MQYVEHYAMLLSKLHDVLKPPWIRSVLVANECLTYGQQLTKRRLEQSRVRSLQLYNMAMTLRPLDENVVYSPCTCLCINVWY